MSIYARSDLMSVSIPETSGGCGATHMRQVTRGAPAKVWKLDCIPCEKYLRGDSKPKVIKVIPGDKEQGIPSRMEHVADADPHWSTTPEGIPATPDEQHVNKIRAERGTQQLQQLSALAALQQAGLKIPDEAFWLLSQNFDQRIIKGTTICPNGHDNPAGVKYCNECGMTMAAGDVHIQIADPDGPENVSVIDDDDERTPLPIPLSTLHIATLKKMARTRGVDPKGTKVQLIERLTS
jgi:hypothetical protein